MKLKKEYLILAVVIVGLALYLGLRKSDRTHYQLPRPATFSPKKITRIEVQSAGGTLELSRKDEAWYLGPQAFPADTGKVDDMLNTLETLNITALVSESGNYVRYDLADDKKITAKIWEGNQLKRELDIGKAADTYQHTFVKLPDDKSIYHAQGNFRGKFDFTLDQLRDKKVLEFETGKINEITIQSGETSVIIAKESVAPEGPDEPKTEGGGTEAAAESNPPAQAKTVWRTADGTGVKKDAVDKLLSSLSNVACSQYMADAQKADLKNPTQTITVKGTEKNYTLSLFEKTQNEEDDVPGTSSMNDYPFYLSGYQADNILNSIKDLLQEPKSETAEKTEKDK